MHGSRKPEIAQQIDWLHQFTKARIQWRKTHSLLFKEKPDYSFILAENGKVKEIKSGISSYRQSNRGRIHDYCQYLCCTILS